MIQFKRIKLILHAFLCTNAKYNYKQCFYTNHQFNNFSFLLLGILIAMVLSSKTIVK